MHKSLNIVDGVKTPPSPKQNKFSPRNDIRGGIGNVKNHHNQPGRVSNGKAHAPAREIAAGVSLGPFSSTKKDYESPYRRFVITTELRSEPKQSRLIIDLLKIIIKFLPYYLKLKLGGGAGGKRGFLRRGGFPLVGFSAVGSYFPFTNSNLAGAGAKGGILSGPSAGGLGGDLSLLDWEAYSAQPHIISENQGKSGFLNGFPGSQFSRNLGGKTLQCK